MKRKIVLLIKKILNCLTRTHRNWIYVAPHDNGLTDHYSLENSGSDNVLSFLKYFFEVYSGEQLTLFLETHKDVQEEQARIDRVLCNGHLRVVPVLSARPPRGHGGTTLRRYFKNLRRRYACAQWWVATPSYICSDKLKKQTAVCFNYYTPFKNDFLVSSVSMYDPFDCVLTTSLLTAQIKVSSLGGRLDRFLITGFPRNDTLLHESKTAEVLHWIEEKTGLNSPRVIVYAPTYSEYMPKDTARFLFGYDDCGELQTLLEEQNCVVIYKPHPLEQYKFDQANRHILKYPCCEHFSLYDVMSCADALISNYSSVAHDFLLTGKPLIYNMPDIEEYKRSRGLSFDPIESVCAGDIVRNWMQMKAALERIADVQHTVSDNYGRVRSMLHKYVDAESCARVLDALFTNPKNYLA